MELIFEWNPKKARANQRKHRVSFQEAKSVFGDPFELMISDPEHSFDEERHISIGESDNGILLLVSYTQVENVIRLISAREAESDEIAQYRERRGAK
jgi:uncharacterized DUF497 family protein